MSSSFAHLGVLAILSACGSAHVPYTNRSDPTCEKRVPDLVIAVEKAGIATHRKYHWSPPADLDASAYLGAARAAPLQDRYLTVLASVDLEVWTKPDCRAAMVVARCPTTKRVILVDDTESTSRVDEPNLLTNPEARPPARPSPPVSCPVPMPP